jgi:hypothetical protein
MADIIDEVTKGTLNRYREKAKARFRAKGGINTALEKQDKGTKKPVKEDTVGASIVDASLEDTPDSTPFFEGIEARCDALLEEKRKAFRQTAFNFKEKEVE